MNIYIYIHIHLTVSYYILFTFIFLMCNKMLGGAPYHFRHWRRSSGRRRIQPLSPPANMISSTACTSITPFIHIQKMNTRSMSTVLSVKDEFASICAPCARIANAMNLLSESS